MTAKRQSRSRDVSKAPSVYWAEYLLVKYSSFPFFHQSEIITKSLLILQGAERLCNAKYVRIHQAAARVC